MREEEFEDLAEAGGPGGFGVLGALGMRVVEVVTFVPAVGEEAVVEEVGIAEVARTLGGAHVEPDAGPG